MRILLFFAANILVILTFAMFVIGQGAPKVINGGVLNGKAVSLPKPVYPAEAKAKKLEGKVSIIVTIDEEGNVVDAMPDTQKLTVKTLGEDGSLITETEALPVPDPMLVESAMAAAKEAKFLPTKLRGQPVRVTGVIVYNFVASTERSISGGVLNGKAIELPLPEFPPAAKAVRASGAVSVQVVIDENGDVISATAVSGHPLLRAAATDAARLAKFPPTTLEGKPVKVSGVLVYNFVPPDEGNN